MIRPARINSGKPVPGLTRDLCLDAEAPDQVRGAMGQAERGLA